MGLIDDMQNSIENPKRGTGTPLNMYAITRGEIPTSTKCIKTLTHQCGGLLAALDVYRASLHNEDIIC